MLGLLLIGGCGVLFSKAADDVGKELDKNHDSGVVSPGGDARADGSSKVDEPDITKDVKVTSCKVKAGEYGIKELDLKIEYINSGDRRFNYLAEGEVTVNGEKKSDIFPPARTSRPARSTRTTTPGPWHSTSPSPRSPVTRSSAS
ncbi:hypothetical protein WKI68_06930 [Streptomyces sp. MS1.HAVA.3]|uniref:DUF4352 domain-containing protein n=1 Tax=Streptomyces caledonius TaxID=3134107 RepID=A0ABU8U065_9ACTN